MIINGTHLETDNVNRPFPGTTVKYVCNEGFFAHGANSENLETVCQEDRSYTLQAKQLATCARIGMFVIQSIKNLCILKYSPKRIAYLKLKLSKKNINFKTGLY